MKEIHFERMMTFHKAFYTIDIDEFLPFLRASFMTHKYYAHKLIKFQYIASQKGLC
jgi:hypothetical protein